MPLNMPPGREAFVAADREQFKHHGAASQSVSDLSYGNTQSLGP
jgi:hypothetical protein